MINQFCFVENNQLKFINYEGIIARKLRISGLDETYAHELVSTFPRDFMIRRAELHSEYLLNDGVKSLTVFSDSPKQDKTRYFNFDQEAIAALKKIIEERKEGNEA